MLQIIVPEVERAALGALGIAGAVEPQVVLEGDDRREDRHLGRAPEDLGAFDRMLAHDHELLLGEPLGLLQDVLRRPDLADVVHERRQTELAQQAALDAERARLAHGQDRHVHHVGEGVVVVVAHRRQRDERRPVLRHRVGEPFDRVQGRRDVGLALERGAFPGRFCRGHGGRVELPDGGHVAGDAVAAGLFRGDAAEPDVREAPRGLGAAGFGRELGDAEHQPDDFLRRDAAFERDALDLVHEQPIDQVLHPAAGFGQGGVGDDELVVDDADGDRRLLLLECLEGGEQALDVAAEQRVVGGVELRGAGAGGKPPQQFFVEREAGRRGRWTW